MGEPVEQGRGHLGIAEDRGPFGEAEVGVEQAGGSDQSDRSLVRLPADLPGSRRDRFPRTRPRSCPRRHDCSIVSCSRPQFERVHYDGLRGAVAAVELETLLRNLGEVASQPVV